MSFTTQYALAVSHSNNSSQAPSINSSSYEEVFGTLSSSYGFAGSAPSALSRTSPSQASSQRASYASTPSQSSSSSSHKNYEVAFGSLYSSYGFGGSAPIVPSYDTPATPSASHLKSKSAATPPKSTSQKSPRNYEVALAQLSSSYGVSGCAAPSWSAQY